MASILIHQGQQILREIQLYKASFDIGRSRNARFNWLTGASAANTQKSHRSTASIMLRIWAARAASP